MDSPQADQSPTIHEPASLDEVVELMAAIETGRHLADVTDRITSSATHQEDLDSRRPLRSSEVTLATTQLWAAQQRVSELLERLSPGEKVDLALIASIVRAYVQPRVRVLLQPDLRRGGRAC